MLDWKPSPQEAIRLHLAQLSGPAHSSGSPQGRGEQAVTLPDPKSESEAAAAGLCQMVQKEINRRGLRGRTQVAQSEKKKKS